MKDTTERSCAGCRLGKSAAASVFKRLLSAANTIRANETRSHCGRDEQSRPPKKFGDIRSDTKSRLITSKSKSGTLGAPPYVLTFSAGGVACPKLYSGVWQW